jgi:hypothetical protein
MNLRLLCAVATVLTLTVASLGHAADSAPKQGALPGRGGLGAQIGTSYIYDGGDYAEGAQPRFSFSADFRYLVNPQWGWQVSPLFTWNGYVSNATAPFVDPNPTAEIRPDGTQSKEHYITQFVGASGQLQRWFTGKDSRWHVGAGPGVYRVVLQNERRVLADTVTWRRHKGTYLGAQAEIGYERFLKKLPNTSLEATATWMMVFSADKDAFPQGWNDSPALVGLRIGGNYYYDFRRPKPAGKGLKK